MKVPAAVSRGVVVSNLLGAAERATVVMAPVLDLQEASITEQSPGDKAQLPCLLPAYLPASARPLVRGVTCLVMRDMTDMTWACTHSFWWLLPSDATWSSPASVAIHESDSSESS